MRDPADNPLDERGQRVLNAIIASYIGGSGEPVGSAAVARRADLDVSPATVRAVMADLEMLGYLEKPHTSAGRVPTDRGFRLFVDSVVLARPGEPRASDAREIERRLAEAPNAMPELLAETTRLLHGLSHHAGIVLAPRAAQEVLRRIELVPLRENRVLAVMITTAGSVLNKLLQLDTPFGPSELERMAALLNERIVDRSLAEVRERLSAELLAERTAYDSLLKRALLLAQEALTPGQESLHIDGQASFLNEPGYRDVDKLRALFSAIEEKSRLLALLERAATARELTIFIGAESGLGSLPDVAIIAAPYEVDGKIVGAVGVLGPSRLDYARVVPVVEYTARAVSRALGGG